MKKLNVKVFDKFWLRSCYYHDLYSGLSCLGIDADGLFWTNVALAEKNFGVAEEAVFSEFSNEKIYGYAQIGCDISENILCKCIDGGCPVIVGVDRCNLEKRVAINGKIHAPHFLLVYGYDEFAGTVNIIDHDEVSSCKYREKTITTDNLFFTNKEYKENYGKNYPHSCKVLYKTGQPIREKISQKVDFRKFVKARENSAENLEETERLFMRGGKAVAESYETVIEYLKKMRRSLRCLEQTEMFANGDKDLSETFDLYSKLATAFWKGHYRLNFDYVAGMATEISDIVCAAQKSEDKLLKSIENRIKQGR